MEIEEARRRAKTGPMLLMGRRIFGLLITFLSMVTVARMVGPRAFGVANMATVLIYLAQIFRDFGLVNAVLRKDHVSQDELTFIFWFNFLTTVVLSLAIVLSAPLVALFYHEPLVEPIILVSVIGFLVSGVTGQHRSLLNRDLRFSTIALIDTGSIICGFIISLSLAFSLRNVWAIVIGSVSQLVLGSLLYVMASRWQPDRPRIIPEAKSLIAFGANSAIFSLSVFMSGNIAPIVIGRLLGSESLGQYNRAWAIFSLPGTNLVEPIAQATLPLLNRLRADPDAYRDAYLSLVRKICAFLMPLSIALCFSAIPLMTSLLGHEWREGGAVLCALAPSFAAMGLGYSLGDLFVTQDRSNELRKIGIIEMVIRVASVLIGVQFGLVGAASAYTISTIFSVIIRTLVAGRKGPVGSLEQFKASIPGIFLSFGGFSGCLFVFIINDIYDLRFYLLELLLAALTGTLLIGFTVTSCRLALNEIIDSLGFQVITKVLKSRFDRIS